MALDLKRDALDILFGRYGASQGVNICSSDYGGVDCSLRFYSNESFIQYLSELSQIQEFIDERNIRESNPTVQRAYDEYKLLLKLSKQ